MAKPKPSASKRTTKPKPKPKQAKPKAKPAKPKPKPKAKPARPKPRSTKATPKAKPIKPNRPTRSAAAPRGASLIRDLLVHLAGPDSPVGKPTPLDAAQLAAAEQAAGVALSPSLHALLAFDAGYLRREYGWFDAHGNLLARPTLEVIAEHAGAFTEAYQPLIEARFPGKAIALDQGSDSMRLLYFGDPDQHGEYPVLFIDHDDTPLLGVAYPGFDAWLGAALGQRATDDAAASARRCTELLGVELWDLFEHADLALPPPVPGPPPGAIARPSIAAPAPGGALTDHQLDLALSEAATDGDIASLTVLVADARTRKRTAALDAAVVAATRTGHAGALRLLLEAGASANARGPYGSALSEAVCQDTASELVPLLLAAGADPNGPSINGETVVHAAVQHASPDVVRLVLDAHGDPGRRDDNGLTPLHAAVQRQPSGSIPDPSIIDVLIDHGADPDGGAGRSTPLIGAVEDGLLDHARRLIARGANLEHRSALEDRTALHVAFARGNDPMVRMLIAAGADRFAKDAHGISLDGIFGPAGEDIRPIEAHYVASPEPQRVELEATLAVLDVDHLASATAQLAAEAWAALARRGLAAGEFDPLASRLDVLEEPPFDDVTSNGFITRRWVIRVAAISPMFLRVIAGRLLGGIAAFTGAGVLSTVRGVGLVIRGERPGEGVDGATLRRWLDDPAAALTSFAGPSRIDQRRSAANQGSASPYGEGPPCGGPLPFALDVEPAAEASVSIRPLGGALDEAQVATLQQTLQAWLGFAASWPLDPTAAGFLIAEPPDEADPHTFRIAGFDYATGQRARRLPFALDPAVHALRNAMRVVHATIPLARVTVRVTD